ncbi:MAG TPA: DMT family transporter [Burkholderiales bacterium]|nr:DMT family transporter [Burkholderiales bacterium]
MDSPRHPGIVAALGAALLFGAGTPAAKLLLEGISPWLLAGVLYLGSGIGLAIFRGIRRAAPVALAAGDIGWLAAATVFGGIAAPVLLMWGLSGTPASTASLLLNAEGVLTALIAWFAFRENFDRRIALGMACIVAGALVLAWPEGDAAGVGGGTVLSALAVVGACLAWAIDNNFTRKVSLADATYVAMVKGLAAGATNTAIAFAIGAAMPSIWSVLAGAAFGFVSYGLSLVLFVVALRHLGAARTGAYFSTAPFVGALLAVAVLGEPVSFRLGLAVLLMGTGVWLHVTERHEHTHTHEGMEHDHEHEHDEHHQHEHDFSATAGTRHSHRHRHEAMTHSHRHYPDAHHRHPH